MAINRLAVNGLDVFRKEGSDVFVCAPVQRNTEFVAVLGFELGFELGLFKQISAEPIQIGKLLVGQLVQLFIGSGCEAGTDKVLQI